MTRRSTQILLTFLGTALLIACGGAEGSAPKAASPAAERAPEAEPAEPRSVEEAQAQIDRFSAQLGAPTKPSAPPAENSPQSKPSPPPASDSAKSDHHNAADSCVSPCRALASMRRAVDALCRMTGEHDNRCVDAKKTLAESVGRTSSCKCP